MSSNTPVTQESGANEKKAFDSEFKTRMANIQKKLQEEQSVTEDLASMRQLVGTLPKKDQAHYNQPLDQLDQEVAQKEGQTAEAAPEAAPQGQGGPQFLTIMQKLLQLLQEAHERYLNGEPFSPKFDQFMGKVKEKAKEVAGELRESAKERREQAIGNENLTGEDNPKLDYVRTEFQEVAKKYTNDDVAVKQAFDKHFNPNDTAMLNVTKGDFEERLQKATEDVASKLENGRYGFEKDIINVQQNWQEAVFTPKGPAPTENAQATAVNQQATRAATPANVQPAAVNQQVNRAATTAPEPRPAQNAATEANLNTANVNQPRPPNAATTTPQPQLNATAANQPQRPQGPMPKPTDEQVAARNASQQQTNAQPRGPAPKPPGAQNQRDPNNTTNMTDVERLSAAALDKFSNDFTQGTQGQIGGNVTHQDALFTPAEMQKLKKDFSREAGKQDPSLDQRQIDRAFHNNFNVEERTKSTSMSKQDFKDRLGKAGDEIGVDMKDMKQDVLSQKYQDSPRNQSGAALKTQGALQGVEQGRRAAQAAQRPDAQQQQQQTPSFKK